jgi:hypothetical protein
MKVKNLQMLLWHQQNLKKSWQKSPYDFWGELQQKSGRGGGSYCEDISQAQGTQLRIIHKLDTQAEACHSCYTHVWHEVK